MIRTRGSSLIRNRMTPFKRWGVLTVLALAVVPGSLRAQVGGSGLVVQSPTSGSITNAINAQQNPFLGSQTQGQPTAGVLDLTILDAIDRGLKANLGLILTQRATEQARAATVRARSELLPDITAQFGEQVQQINLAAFGFPPTPGLAPVRGPFGVFDARAGVTQPIMNVRRMNELRSSRETLTAANFNYRNARDVVVLVVGASYLQAIASGSRVDAAQAQFETARTLFQRATDLKKAGMVAGIDVLRANVEMQAQQQRVIAAQNQFEKDKLSLGRVIGLPLGQQFRLADTIPYSPAPETTFESSLARAYQNRADYQAAQALVRAADLSRRAAAAQRLPELAVTSDYGTIGPTPGNSHGTFTTGAALRIPIFEGGRIRADVDQAEAALNQRRAEADDLRSRIEFEVRSAYLDMNSAAQQVEVARGALDLAREQLKQAQDRFAAGVTNNIEVVQAQDALALTNENYIGALFAFNFAKLSLARAAGVAEDATKKYLMGGR